MTLRWTVDHAARLVEVVLDAETTLVEALGLLDAIEAEGAVGYGKLVDARLARPHIDSDVLSGVAARIADLANPGPIAVVVPAAGPVDGLSRLFLLVSDVERRARVFRNEAGARSWLAEASAGAGRT